MIELATAGSVHAEPEVEGEKKRKREGSSL